MNLNLNEEQMRQVVTKAILEGLGEEQKTLILTQAVEHLMGVPQEQGYSYNQDKRNRLQRAFDGAAEQALMKIAREEFEKPENVERVRQLLAPIAEKLLSDPNAYKAREYVAHALSEALNKT